MSDHYKVIVVSSSPPAQAGHDNVVERALVGASLSNFSGFTPDVSHYESSRHFVEQAHMDVVPPSSGIAVVHRLTASLTASWGSRRNHSISPSHVYCKRSSFDEGSSTFTRSVMGTYESPLACCLIMDPGRCPFQKGSVLVGCEC